MPSLLVNLILPPLSQTVPSPHTEYVYKNNSGDPNLNSDLFQEAFLLQESNNKSSLNSNLGFSHEITDWPRSESLGAPRGRQPLHSPGPAGALGGPDEDVLS